MKIEIKLKYTLEYENRRLMVNKIINFSYLIYYSHEREQRKLFTFKIKVQKRLNYRRKTVVCVG